ncbi:sterol desaturase family protein [Variovorax sp. LjRoot175]|uniref:sterol desaturase family protein n=1 Tax=Variovorax sp. LjRoot175 TaxID=3342276 RepID=UPI003ECC7135
MTPTPFELALNAWPTIWLGDWLRYLIPTALASAVIGWLPAWWRQARSVQAHRPGPGQRWREFRISMVTVLIFSANGALIYGAAQAGRLCLYTDITRFGPLYLLVSFVALVLAHDTWFYWTHRWMHHPVVFRLLHRTHHRSVAPTPWAAYSFAPAEAVVQAVFLTLTLLVLPLHPLVIFVFLLHMIVRNVLGHAGIEMMPRRWLAGRWGRWLTTTLHHDMHHAGGRYNYGLYFTCWDRLGGTEHPDYRRRLRMLTGASATKRDGSICPTSAR